MALASITESTDEGKRLRASAQEILRSLGSMEKAKVFAQSRFNGDGVVSLDIIDAAATKAVAESVIACVGAATDRSGRAGVSQETIDAFFAESEAYVAWYGRSASEAATLLPLGEATVKAYAALQAVRAKVEDYFARCRVAAFDARATAALNRDESAYAAVAARALGASASDVAEFPLATVGAGRPLPLGAGVNPAWASAIATFYAQVVQPLLGARETLAEAEWHSIVERFSGYGAWESEKHGAKVEALGSARVRDILGSDARSRLNALIAEDNAVAPAMNAIDTWSASRAITAIWWACSTTSWRSATSTAASAPRCFKPARCTSMGDAPTFACAWTTPASTRRWPASRSATSRTASARGRVARS